MGDDIGYATHFTINAWQPTWVYSPTSDAFQQFIKAEQKREEKERNYKEFKEFTRMLERTYCN